MALLSSTTPHPTSLRALLIAASTAVATLVLGFAPFPQVFYVLGGALLVSVIALGTGSTFSLAQLLQPLTGLTGIAMLTVAVIRGTALVWMAVPVLAGLVAVASWLIITNRDTTLTPDKRQDAVAGQGPATTPDELTPRRDEKTAATDEDSSATAA